MSSVADNGSANCPSKPICCVCSWLLLSLPLVLRQVVDPSCFEIPPESAAFFRRHLASFVPPNFFDAHAHLFDLRHLLAAEEVERASLEPEIGFSTMLASMSRWMGDAVASAGLYFPFPLKSLDCDAANRFLAGELASHPQSRGLMMIRPTDDPQVVERQVLEQRWAGFKVYHVFADRSETFHAHSW